MSMPIIAVGVPLDGWTKGAPVFVTAQSAVPTAQCQPRSHDVLVMDGEDRQFITVSRFGDIECAICHVPLAWSPALVREGVFSEGTAAWIAGQVKAHTEALTNACADCGATARRHLYDCPIWERIDALMDERASRLGL